MNVPVASSGSASSRWLLPGLIMLLLAGTGVVGWLAARAVPQIKLLLLFPMLLCAAYGYATGRMLGRFGISSRRAAVACAVPLSLGIVAAYHLCSLQQYRAARVEEFRRHVVAQPGGEALWQQLQSPRLPANPIEAEFLQVYRSHYHARLNATWQEFSRRRIAGLGEMFSAGPVWYWLIPAIEMLAATVAGCYMAASSEPVPATTPEPTA